VWCTGDAEQPADDGWQSEGHGRAEVLSAGDISDQCTRGDQIRRCLVLLTSVDGRAEFVLDALRNVEPVELSMQQVGQAASSGKKGKSGKCIRNENNTSSEDSSFICS